MKRDRPSSSVAPEDSVPHVPSPDTSVEARKIITQILMVVALVLAAVAVWGFVEIKIGHISAKVDTTSTKVDKKVVQIDRVSKVAEDNQQLAIIAARLAYHNCGTTAALTNWAKKLGAMESRPQSELSYHTERKAAFNDLERSLRKFDGGPCIDPDVILKKKINLKVRL